MTQPEPAAPFGERELICDQEPVSFYLGTHHPHWVREAPRGVCLFISHNRLKGMKRLPVATPGRGLAVDSGAFMELDMFGKFRTSPEEYVDALLRYDDEICDLAWAAPQDMMCEPFMLVNTGLSIEAHQRATVANFLRLVELWPSSGHGDCPVMPVIQGWTIDDYVRCVGYYEAAGVRLADDYEVVGVGSVCRRQGTAEIGEIFRTLAQLDLPLHGFGVKTQGLAKYGRWLCTADSMAWSAHFRRLPPVDGCMGARGNGVKNCANCLHAALTWRDHVLDVIAKGEDAPEQLDLWSAA